MMRSPHFGVAENLVLSLWIRALAAAAAATLGLVAGPALHAGASTGWATTSTQAEPTGGLTALGALAPSTPVPVTVALRLRNADALQQAIAAHQKVTPAQFAAQYSPTQAQSDAVVAYLQQQGFTGVRTSDNRVLVTATGTAAQVSSAFNTTMSSFTAGGRTVFANTSPAQVPTSLAGTVGAVLGLNSVGTMTTPLARTSATNPPSSCAVSGVGYPCTYNPQGFWTAYDATSAPTGSATSIAIFAEGDLTQVVKDLRQEEKANGLAQVPLTVRPTGPASTDTSGADEWDLDTQYSTGMAGTVKHLYVYDATSLTDSDIAREFNAFVTQDVAQAGSASFGECEYQAYLDGSMLADDEAFAQAAVQGQTVFASSGDTGGFCPVAPNNGVPLGIPDVNYPASSPYVVSVGGTTLVTNSDGTYDQEIAWLAGGGGPSFFEASPAWQSGVAPPASTLCSLQALTACGRTVPDVAMDADPNSGANVYVDGTPEGVGGTSLASPLTLGVWARLESVHTNSLGFGAPPLYHAYQSAGFHDITLGDTGPYPATPGYDLATGMGSFDVAQMESVIAGS
jgi:subtilase family serine protease